MRGAGRLAQTLRPPHCVLLQLPYANGCYEPTTCYFTQKGIIIDAIRSSVEWGIRISIFRMTDGSVQGNIHRDCHPRSYEESHFHHSSSPVLLDVSAGFLP